MKALAIDSPLLPEFTPSGANHASFRNRRRSAGSE
ncbi:hypothetical protein SAMN05216559_3513 [Halomicrobium zhouii]|uniref:Uncharacterized protein n=1 Tax=Halomicrobium zhouii TaxID=767519 RepID=A0A1I6LZH8_9EURY|nr:hypothetical protein SAMN05216559_3513 [Halomicrobium zhouii]